MIRDNGTMTQRWGGGDGMGWGGVGATDSLLLKLISLTALRHKYEASQQSPS